MKMTEFRVQNYKKIKDTRWVKCGDITAFVGKNESGKSAIFRGLSKINPSDGEEYDGLKEFPRKRFTSEFKRKDWPVSSVRFKLDSRDINELAKIYPPLGKISKVEVTRYYSNKHCVEFEPQVEHSSTLISSYLDFLNDCKLKIDNLSPTGEQIERMDQIKNEISNVLAQTIQSLNERELPNKVNVEAIQNVADAITRNLNEEERKLHSFKEIIDKNNEILKDAKIADQIDKAKGWIIDNMPRYIYFDRYDIIDSAVNIDVFIMKYQNDPADSSLRITKCLFQHVGLDLDQISSLNPNNIDSNDPESRRMADERHILMSSASDDMTEKFANWWEQRKHKFRYQIDGKFFRVWVSDDIDSSEIELDQRSAGLQYFFSFYLIFLVESSRAHVNSVLLLDEPGLHYHGTAQGKTVNFLQKISKENQVLYSTHSPFMIDGDRLNDVRIVYEDKGSTTVSSDVWPNDPDSLFPLQAGLGYSLAKTLFYSEYNFVVEGLTDHSILSAMNELVTKREMKALDSDIVITPSGGASKLMPLASILIANKMKIVILLDADETGIQKEKQLKEKLLVNCLLLDSFVTRNHVELEDLFPEELYMKAFKEAYPNKEIQFNEEENSIPYITKRIAKAFERLKLGDFKKWKASNILVRWIQEDSDENKIPDDTCATFAKIFTRVNELLKQNN